MPDPADTAGGNGEAATPFPTKLLLRVGQAVLTIAILYFVWRSVSSQVTNKDFLEALSRGFSIGYLIAAWLVLACYYLLFAGGFLPAIRALGYRPAYRYVFKLSFAANLGKYLPGGVWQVAGKVAMSKRVGVDRHAALVAAVVESAVSVTGGLLVFSIAALAGEPLPGKVPPWPPVLLMVAIFVVLQPQIFGRLIALGMRLLKIEGEPPHLSFLSTVRLVAYYAAIWLVAGGAFWLFTRSLVPQPGADWLAYSGYYSFAAVVGLLVLFMPAGLGVREGILFMLLSPLMGAGFAAIVAGAARVWSTLAELLLSAIAVALPYARGEEDTAAAGESV